MYFICRKGEDSLATSATNITVLYVTLTRIAVQCFPLYVEDKTIIRMG